VDWTCATQKQNTLEGQMEEKRSRGRKRIATVGDIRNGSAYSEMKRRGENREECIHDPRDTEQSELTMVPLK